jgi:protein involved in polysaccharide export with SLBB domain
MLKRTLLVVLLLLLPVAFAQAQSGFYPPGQTLPSVEAMQQLAQDSSAERNRQAFAAQQLVQNASVAEQAPAEAAADLKPIAEERKKTSAEAFFSRPFSAVGETLGARRAPQEDDDRDKALTAGLQSAKIDLDLRQFGLDFFSRERMGFAPDELSLVGPDYVLGPGDTLMISLWGNVEGQHRVTVGRNGEITLPNVGTFSVWGQTFSEAKETIRQQIGRYFTNFELSVTMDALRSIQVFVIGEVHTPGRYTVSSLATVLTSLATAGGPSGNGSLRNIQLKRGGQTVATIDLYDFFLRGDKSGDVRMQSGDTLFVPVAGTLVGVAGDVRRPAIYELKGGETLPQILAMAGGTNPTAFLEKIQVERVDPSSRKRVVIDANLQEGATSADLLLRDRDLVKVLPASALTGQYVRLTGHVARPGSYQVVPDMRLADLVGGQDNLLPGYFPGVVEILRLEPPEYRPGRLTVHLDKALRGDPEHNIPLQEYDEVRIFSAREMEEIPETVVSGAVLNPGSYRLYDNMTVRDLVVAGGNVKRSAYLAEAEITRFVPAGRETKTERMLIDLENALAGDPQHSLTLSPDDHLFVRSIPDYGEKFTVQVGGEVLFPGTYAIHKGETLSSVLERAGGFTNDAYLRGAVFSRESLKEIQQQRLNQLIAEQEQEIMRISSEMAQGAISKEEMAAAQEIVANRSAMLDKLKNTPVLGRMVVRLDEMSEFRGSRYDIELMGGDALTVPKSSQSVSVFGQVYNPITLAHQPGKTVGYYLKQVGGAKKDANTDEMFVVRADGTVVSAAQSGWGLRWDGDSKRWLAGGFNATILHPGDSILVPQEVEKSAWLREFKDISTIIYQIALGAAAVASF